MFTLYTIECILSIKNVKIYKLFSRKHFHNTRKNEQNKRAWRPLCWEQFSPDEIPCFFESAKSDIKSGFLPSGAAVFPFFNSPFMFAALTIYGRKSPAFLFIVPFPHYNPPSWPAAEPPPAYQNLSFYGSCVQLQDIF